MVANVKLPHALRSLEHRDLRLFFAGQAVSLVGTWMQSVAMSWLVWRLTGSSTMLGWLGFLSQVPVSIFGMWAGTLADRFPRRRIVIITQANAVAQAALLSVLTLTGAVEAWMLLPLGAMLGLTYAFEIPARQSLLADIAGESTDNAVALNSSIVNAGRLVGPAIAGFVVAQAGEGICFALNALSFGGTLYALWVMRPPVQERSHRTSGALREGLLHAWNARLERALLLLLSISALCALPYSALLPVFASKVLHGDATLFGKLLACAGAGALFGAVVLLARRSTAGLARWVGWGANALAGGLLCLSLSTEPVLSGAALVVAGFGFITQMAGTMTLLQTLTPPPFRGRVMGLFSTLFVGVSPFGVLLAGWAAERIGAPWVTFAGASVVTVAALGFHLALPSLRRGTLSRHPTLFPRGVP
jgi:MFS family permease